jgi:anti-anti-sigma factor
VSARDTVPTPGIEHTALCGAPAVAVRGELDAGTAPALEATLDGLIQSTTGVLVIDLSELVSLDRESVTVLLRARSLLGREDRQLAIVCPPGAVRDVLDIIPLPQLFAVFDSREQAARAIVPRRGGAPG